MSTTISPNTQAILLLTAPLIAGKKTEDAPCLTPSEYNRLARLLREKDMQPADLLGANAGDLIGHYAAHFGKDRLETLLGRGFLLSQAADRWHARGIWVISRADAAYPRRLKARLREDAPPLLYGCGEISLLERGGLAVVGSRHVDDALKEYTMNVGAMAAASGRAIVSGAARGIDSSAMAGALDAEGVVVGVMADSLERASLAQGNREALRAGRLVLISPYDPAAGFNVGHAMQRNKAIYALADAGLVVTSDFQKGGTWAGAIEQLEKLHFVPVFVRNGSNAGKGNAALLQHGGIPWPEPQNARELDSTLDAAAEFVTAVLTQETLPLLVREEPLTHGSAPEINPTVVTVANEGTPPSDAKPSPEAELMDAVRGILCRELVEARTEDEVAVLLAVAKPQAKAWLVRLVEELVIEKVAKSKPSRYQTITPMDRLL